MNYLEKVVRGITYDGNRLKGAWLMALGSYAYTRSFAGATYEDGTDMGFTRWYAFKGAVETFWDYLTRRAEGQR